METNQTSRRVKAAEEYYVEMDGLDGLKHHVGPFKNIARAEDWLAQHSPAQVSDRERTQTA